MIVGNMGNLARVLRRSRREQPPPEAGTFLLQETFETSPGYDLAWTVISGTPDPDNNAVAIDGVETLVLDASGGVSQTIASPVFAVTTDFWFYCMFNPNVYHAAGNASLAQFFNGGVLQCELVLNAAGLLRVESGSVAITADANPANNVVHLWLHYIAGSGANAFLSGAFSGTGIKPVAGTKYCEIVNGTGTLGIDRFRLTSQGGGVNAVWHVDRVRASAFSIGDNGDLE